MFSDHFPSKNKMRNHISLFLTACLLFGLFFAAIAKAESGVDQLSETLVNRINSTLNPDKVVRKPVNIEGTKIIPLVSYGFGFGAGREVTSDGLLWMVKWTI